MERDPSVSGKGSIAPIASATEANVTPELEPPMTLYPDRRLAIGLIPLAVLLLLTSAWLAWKVGLSLGGPVAILGLLVLIGSMVWLIPSRTYLHLADRGFIACHWFQARRIDWVEVDRFGVVTIDGEPRVAWNYASHYPAEVFERERTKKQTGFEAVLPRCCSMTPEALAALLNRRKQQAIG